MSLALAGPATSFASTIFSYFNPARSPFYGVIAFGTSALILSAERIERMPWLLVAVPVYLVLFLSLALSLKYRPSFEKGQGEDQLTFARSFAISSALIAFVMTARSSDGNDLAFWTNFVVCLSQIVVFLAYAWARSQSTEEQAQFNFVQFALISITFLVGASYSNISYADLGENPGARRYLVVAAGLYFLWFISLLRWIKHLATLIRVEIPAYEKDSTES